MRLAVLLVLLVAIAALAHQWPATSSSLGDAVQLPERRRTGVRGADKLDPALAAALRRASKDAAADGLELYVRSGRRSPEHQERLLREAISRYGSAAEAARWVATPKTSPHVSGDAVDIGPSEAATWLSERGAQFGLCQIYANEPWHYELRPDAVDSGCPAMFADPTQDPRM